MREVRNKNGITSSYNRETEHYEAGKLSGRIGIFCNSLLFVCKLSAGLMSASAAVVTDAFNNLSDCLNSVISFAAACFSEKPADSAHPFGHGRAEYIVSFLMTVFIMLFGLELMKTGIERILRPRPVFVSALTVLILAASIGVKAGLYVFNRDLYRKSGNEIVRTTAQDSLNDVLATSVTLASLFLTRAVPGIPADGIAAVIVSLFILKAGGEMGYEIINRLMGVPADAETAGRVEKVLLARKEIIGVHDLVLHDYGHERMMGSADAEMDSRLSLIEAHAVIDSAEREIMERFGISMTVHVDPVDVNDRERRKLMREAGRLLKEPDSRITVHDFRIMREEGRKEVFFDILLPENCSASEEELRSRLDDWARESGFEVNVTFDHAFTGREDHE